MDNMKTRTPNSCIMESISAPISIDIAAGDNLVTNKRTNSDALLEDALQSLIINGDESIDNYDFPSFKLLDGDEKLKAFSAEQFITQLKIPSHVTKVKVVSIFGKTGDGKSYTLNKTFFNGHDVFPTSPRQESCTLGVWAAFDPNLNVICLDTEGLLGISQKNDQRNRLLLKVLAVSDIVVYRAKAERLHSDMYTFLGSASMAYTEHFHPAFKQVLLKTETATTPSALGPSIIIFHETIHTSTLNSSASVSESPEDILRTLFSKLNLSIDAFSSLKYVGVQTKNFRTSFEEFKNAVQLELEDTKVRSARSPVVIYNTLKGLNDKFNSHLINNQPEILHLEQYFTCQEKCHSCEMRCTLSLGHKKHDESHHNPNRCKYQHQYQNCIYLCKKCHMNGQRVVVKPSYQLVNQNSWSTIFNYVWSGYVIECKNCGEIYRSRQHWYGNKDPDHSAVIEEIVHIWPGEENYIPSQNSAQRVLDGVNSISSAVINAGAEPTKVVSSWVADKIAPSYWKPNSEITHCHKCNKLFTVKASKHHCRACGEGFCDACSSRKRPVPLRGWNEDVRVCDLCFDETQSNITCEGTDDSEIKFRKYGEAVAGTISAITSVLEIPKGIIKDQARPAYWIPDSDCKNCACCNNPFGPVFQLHHCRECGGGVCDDCSTSRRLVLNKGWDSPVRVCDNCLKDN